MGSEWWNNRRSYRGYWPEDHDEVVPDIPDDYATKDPDPEPEPAVLDEGEVERYAYSLIADEVSIHDVPADYQDAVKEKRLRILRGD